MVVPQALIGALRGARHVFVLTGSGVSAESGVPTFREAQTGLWSQFDPHELATPDAFRRDPALVWRWYRWRRELVARAEPNAGHRALASLAGKVPELTLVTQNVDGLHQRAGSSRVVEFHGNILATRCMNPACAIERDDSRADVPRCVQCGDLLRPGVVWFGESIPPGVLETATIAAADCNVFLSVGTSALVWPAAGLADTAAGHGATIVEINPDTTPLSAGSDFHLQGKAGEWLPKLLNCLAS